MRPLTFKQQYTVHERLEESQRIRQKYPERVPVICERNWNTNMKTLERTKFLIPSDFTVGQLMYVIRKRLSLPCEKAIFLFIAGTVQSISTDMLSLYDSMKDYDGFLYITYSDENVFGYV